MNEYRLRGCKKTYMLAFSLFLPNEYGLRDCRKTNNKCLIHFCVYIFCYAIEMSLKLSMKEIKNMFVMCLSTCTKSIK